ncbi:MAG TPA: 3-phosphoshikimate 1-carboxyvinyltransferase [Armatimonadota bacterium]|jgi:3-phosphoshikimate 1-carboxyvinyltransferase
MPVLAEGDRFLVSPSRGLKGTLRVPGDKSLSHRAGILGALAKGETRAAGFLDSQDCLNTVECLARMGVEVSVQRDEPGRALLTVQGRGPDALREPADILDSGNSGTGIRLMAGLLSGLPFFSCLTGDAQVRRRPMGRIVDPLRSMGARITGRQGGALAPLAITGGGLHAVDYASPVASAQVKSAVLLAGLSAEGTTSVQEPALSRDHTERMLRAFGAQVESQGTRACLRGRQPLEGQRFAIAGDISSAAFLIVAALLTPDSDLLLEGVGVNPTRTGILDVLLAMGADLSLEAPRTEGGEPVADLRVRSSSLRGTEVGGDLIPRLIDEVPILAVAAAMAKGETVYRDATELRVKETDRVETTASMLRAFGAVVETLPDGLRIQGGARLVGSLCSSQGDHRIAMGAAVAGLAASGQTVVDGTSCTLTSFPGFSDLLSRVCQQ